MASTFTIKQDGEVTYAYLSFVYINYGTGRIAVEAIIKEYEPTISLDGKEITYKIPDNKNLIELSNKIISDEWETLPIRYAFTIEGATASNMDIINQEYCLIDTNTVNTVKVVVHKENYNGHIRFNITIKDKEIPISLYLQ